MLKVEQIKLSRKGQNFHFDFKLKPASKLAIMGPSGSGKSTLLDLISGFASPSSGSLSYDGLDFTTADVAARPVTLLSQSDNLFPHLNLFQNVALGLTTKANLTTKHRELTLKAIENVGLSGHKHKLPTALSGGQQQRAALARSLLKAKPILLLDEPFSALDQDLRADMASLVNNICNQHGLTLITVTHDERDAALLSDKVVQLNQGTLIF